ncbi:MAG: aspartate kinase, partial [Clostridia bacterium]|nr:aspartate kinase [Clostridia bacterium]
MSVLVCKFGGSSLSSSEQFKKVKDIITADESRRYVVPSAPGKRFKNDIKVTDLLNKCVRVKDDSSKLESVISIIRERYDEIKEALNIDVDIDTQISKIKEDILKGASMHYVLSRGEYLNGILLSAYLGYEFVDAADIIFFYEDGRLDFERTVKAVNKRLKETERAVIPGFYGSFPDGSIATFSRGGSDVTGSLITRGVNADLYENWTDVSGFMMADPRIVENVKVIPKLSYAELRELSYMGATVLHEESIFPVSDAGIPICVKNTNRPEDKGTLIVPFVETPSGEHIITGVAGKKGYTAISVEKDMMNNELGFVRKMLSVLEDNNVSFEHLPTGIDTLSVVISDTELSGKLNAVIDGISKRCNPDKIEITEDLAVIATVGHGMSSNVGVAATLFGGLAKENINIKMIDQGSSELNIIVGV